MLPADDATLKNLRAFMLLTSPECTGDADDQLPRAFGLAERDGCPQQQLIVLRDGFPHPLQKPGTLTALVGKFADAGLLPGAPADSCERPGAAPCEHFYERSTGRRCQLEAGACRPGPPETQKRDGLCVLAVRGTDPRYLSNLFLDTTIKQKPLPDGWGGAHCQDGRCLAHEGFISAAEKLLPPVESALRDFGCESVVVTGHSLGGAVATMMGFALSNRGKFRVEGSYSFEAPRFANRALAQAMDAGSYDVVRVTKSGDPVPILPTVGPFLGQYQHTGREVFFDAGGAERRCDSAACETSPGTCECAEGWRRRSWEPPHDIGAHTSFQGTPLDWGEAAGCPWPRALQGPNACVRPVTYV